MNLGTSYVLAAGVPSYYLNIDFGTDGRSGLYCCLGNPMVHASKSQCFKLIGRYFFIYHRCLVLVFILPRPESGAREETNGPSTLACDPVLGPSIIKCHVLPPGQ